MDTYTIIAATLASMAVIGLVWLGAYDLGFSAALKRERALADRRVQGVLDELRRKPVRKAAKIRAKRRAA